MPEVSTVASELADILRPFISTTPGTGGLPLIAASNSPASVKAVADYVCDGTDDQVQINAALLANISAASGGTRGGAMLAAGGLFKISGPIIVRRGQVLMSYGMLCEIRATTSFNDYMIKNNASSDNMIRISGILVNGNFLGVGGIGLTNQATSFPQSGDNDRPGTNPDSVHWVDNVYVRAPGNSNYAGHGLYMGTGGAGTGNARGNRVHNFRCMDATGDGIHLDAASDSFIVQSLCTTRDGIGGVGYKVGGGSTKLEQCKTAYTNSHGFDITSSRAQLTGCSAQDSGGHGYNITSDAHLTGCQADSNGRLLAGGADGYFISASDILMESCRALDRNQSAQRQRHGFNYQSGTNVGVTGQAYNQTGNKFNNTAGFEVASNSARVLGGGSVYRWNA